jgi:sugar lactone lactonase YvrE
MTYRQVGKVAGQGHQPDRFVQAIRGITVDREGGLFTAGDSEVKVFDTEQRLRRRWPTSKPALTIAVTGDGRVFVGEPGQVEIFSSQGRLIRTWVDSERMARVTSIGFAGDSVLMGDARGRCIRRYDENGTFLHDIGKENRMQGFLIPNGIVHFDVDAAGVIHVTNPGKHRVERYTIEDKLLGHIGRFDGIDPAGFSGCCNPTNVSVAGRDRIYCTEKAEPRAKVYDFAGNLLAVIAAEVFDPNCKNMDIAVDGRGRVYVADTVRLEILVFEAGG